MSINPTQSNLLQPVQGKKISDPRPKTTPPTLAKLVLNKVSFKHPQQPEYVTEGEEIYICSARSKTKSKKKVKVSHLSGQKKKQPLAEPLAGTLLQGALGVSKSEKHPSTEKFIYSFRTLQSILSSSKRGVFILSAKSEEALDGGHHKFAIIKLSKSSYYFCDPNHHSFYIHDMNSEFLEFYFAEEFGLYDCSLPYAPMCLEESSLPLPPIAELANQRQPVKEGEISPPKRTRPKYWVPSSAAEVIESAPIPSLEKLARRALQSAHPLSPEQEKMKSLSEIERGTGYAGRLYANLEKIPEIQDGYGEFIVYHKKGKEISKELYLKANKILQLFRNVPNRVPKIQKKLRELDKDLKIRFVPRTIYEMIYVRNCIEEEMSQKKTFQNSNVRDKNQLEFFSGKKIENQTKEQKETDRRLKESWNWVSYNQDTSDYQKLLQEKKKAGLQLSYKMNNFLSKTHPKKGFYSGKEIKKMTEDNIQWFQEHYENEIVYSSEFQIQNCHQPSVLFTKPKKKLLQLKYYKESFSEALSEYTNRDRWKIVDQAAEETLGLPYKESYSILSNAVGLECSTVAQNATLVYRAGNFEMDHHLNPVATSEREAFESKSLSYATGLFPGYITDVTACALYYGVNREYTGGQGRDVFITIIPHSEKHNSVIHTPEEESTMTQFSGCNDMWHARTRISHTLGSYDSCDGFAALGWNYFSPEFFMKESWASIAEKQNKNIENTFLIRENKKCESLLFKEFWGTVE